MSSQKTALCRYRYDALDQLVGREPAGQEKTQRFYCREHLATKLDGQASQSVFQIGKQLLAEQRREGDDLESRCWRPISNVRSCSSLTTADLFGGPLHPMVIAG